VESDLEQDFDSFQPPTGTPVDDHHDNEDDDDLHCRITSTYCITKVEPPVSVSATKKKRRKKEKKMARKIVQKAKLVKKEKKAVHILGRHALLKGSA